MLAVYAPELQLGAVGQARGGRQSHLPPFMMKRGRRVERIHQRVRFRLSRCRWIAAA